MPLGVSGTALPTTGVGNLGNLNLAGAPIATQQQPVRPTAQPMQPQPAPPIGNINPGPPPAPQAAPAQQGNFSQVMAQLHPEALNALRSISPQAMQRLHAAGLIHPGVMGHFYGQQR